MLYELVAYSMKKMLYFISNKGKERDTNGSYKSLHYFHTEAVGEINRDSERNAFP